MRLTHFQNTIVMNEQLFAIVAGIIAISAQMVFRPAISNFLGWVLITFKKPFKVGDFIRSGNYEGVVKSKNFNGIELEQTDLSKVVLPNALVTSKPVVNKSKYNLRPISTTFTLSNTLPRKEVSNLLLSITEMITRDQGLREGSGKVQRISEAGIEIKVQAFCSEPNLYRYHKNKFMLKINDLIPLNAWPPVDLDVHMKGVVRTSSADY